MNDTTRCLLQNFSLCGRHLKAANREVSPSPEGGNSHYACRDKCMPKLVISPPAQPAAVGGFQYGRAKAVERIMLKQTALGRIGWMICEHEISADTYWNPVTLLPSPPRSIA